MVPHGPLLKVLASTRFLVGPGKPCSYTEMPIKGGWIRPVNR